MQVVFETGFTVHADVHVCESVKREQTASERNVGMKTDTLTSQHSIQGRDSIPRMIENQLVYFLWWFNLNRK